MDSALAASWRKRVFLLLWHDVHAYCPFCLKEHRCRLRIARLTDGGELRDLTCFTCQGDATRAPEGATIYLSQQQLDDERAQWGLRVPPKQMAKMFISGEQMDEIERRNQVREFNDQRIAFALRGLESEDTGAKSQPFKPKRRIAPVYSLHDRKNALLHPPIVRNRPPNRLTAWWQLLRGWFSGDRLG